MTQQQVEMRKKRARTIFGPVSKFVQKCNGRDGKRFRAKPKFLHENVVYKQKKILKRRLKNDIVRRIAGR